MTLLAVVVVVILVVRSSLLVMTLLAVVVVVILVVLMIVVVVAAISVVGFVSRRCGRHPRRPHGCRRRCRRPAVSVVITILFGVVAVVFVAASSLSTSSSSSSCSRCRLLSWHAQTCSPLYDLSSKTSSGWFRGAHSQACATT